MSVTIPTDVPLVTVEALLRGDFNVGTQEPLETILEALNYYWATHRPPLINDCPINKMATSQEHVTAATPSADVSDGVRYDFHFFTRRASTGGTVTVSVDYGATDSKGGGAGWTNIFSQAHSHSTATVEQWSQTNQTIPSTARYFRFQTSAAVNCQLQAILVLPRVLTSIGTGKLASLFEAFDNAMLAGAGGTIHTELFNRLKRGFDGVAQDREQRVFGYMGSADYNFKLRDASSDFAVAKGVAWGPGGLKGQQGATLTLRGRADDSAGSPGTVVFGEVGGQIWEFDADDTDYTGTIELVSDEPTFFCRALAGTSDFYVNYACASWTPGA